MTLGPSPSIARRPASLPPLELWGGIECTVNRVGDRYIDQIALSGHPSRIEDLDRFAGLGIKTLRYPVLWERVAPGDIANADWSESDRALHRLRELGITPIVGLVHHGSGPKHTSLVDAGFADKLAEYAAAVARRYPWIDMVTPVNEPLTTARFSGLYGLWYPHARDDRSFVRAFINLCLAIRGSMDAFRAINASVRLIQTEDLGKTYSTPARSYQAAFENERRWLTVDVLSGCVNEHHALWRYLIGSGATQDELESFIERPCVPDVVGVNHYLTGERFLDERIELYPPATRGGNGRHEYADVEAVRVLENGIAGHLGLLSEAWNRYHLPLAITEVHLGCTREQQLRWLSEAWQSAIELRDEGCDVRAVTVWSLLGCHDWDSLLTRENRNYEPGAFDVRSARPRPTAIAQMAKSLATNGKFDHPGLDGDGWWRKKTRISHAPVRITSSPRSLQRTIHTRRPILITGARGTLGSAFARICGDRGLEFRALPRAEIDITDASAIENVLDQVEPWAVVNAAGYVRVDDAEWDATNCYRVNTDGAVNLARACAARKIRFATFSTDLVFDGNAARPYTESDPTNPLGVYGDSKAEAERSISAFSEEAMIVRTSAFFGPWDEHNFLTRALSSIAEEKPVEAADDMVVSPTYVPDLVNAVLDLLLDGERGIWHLANRGDTSWAEFARRGARAAGLNPEFVVGVPAAALGQAARRPVYSALGSGRGSLLPSLDHAIARYVAARPARVPFADAANV